MTSSTERPVLLRMRGISKRFSGVQALLDVSLSADSGEVVALIGENGAGKSTLMKVLGGVYRPDSGEILVNGDAAKIASVADSLRCGIAFIHQELNTLDNLDVASNVFLGREPLVGRELRLVDRSRMWRECQPFLDQLGLKGLTGLSPQTPVGQLSIAHRQMVEIAKALSLRARVVIMDEPTSSLTLAETDRLIEVIRGLRQQGVAIIYISHRLGEVRQVADRVTALRDGRNAGELSSDEIEHDAMVRLMVGRDIPPRSLSTPAAGAAKPVLSVRGLRTRRYPHCAISFDLHAGEIVGMAGLIGAGRTEAAQAIFGVETAVAGEFELYGRSVRIGSPRDAIRSGIYLAPEDRRTCGIVAEMSVGTNVTLPAMERFSRGGLIDSRLEQRAGQEAIKTLSVRAPSADFLVGNLSGGNQQKVVLAKWLALSPKVLILDEPTRGIDVGAKAEIYDLVRSLAANGVAILAISSDMEEVLNLSDRIIVMHEGLIAGQLHRSDADEESVMQLAVGADTN